MELFKLFQKNKRGSRRGRRGTLVPYKKNKIMFLKTTSRKGGVVGEPWFPTRKKILFKKKIY